MEEKRTSHPERVKKVSEILKPGQVGAVVIDDIPGRRDLYVELIGKYPDLEIIGEFKGPVAQTYTIQVKKI